MKQFWEAMKTLEKYGEWLFWKTYYLFKPIEQDVVDYLERMIRTRPPWWKFEPNLRRNEVGKQWEIYFDNDYQYVTTIDLNVEAYIGEDGEIKGLVVYDETLRKAANTERERRR